MVNGMNVNPLVTRRSLFRSSAMLGGGALLCAVPFAAPAFAQAGQSWPGVRAFIDSYVGQGKVANMIAGLGWRQDDLSSIAAGPGSLGGVGVVDADTLYRIYSMTKPITGMAVMMCIEDGLLSLDQPLAEILPAFANMQVLKDPGGAITPDNLEPATRPITIRNCLTHTAGLGYSIVQSGPISQLYDELGLVPGRVTRMESVEAFRMPAVRGLDVFAERLAQVPLVYQPGERWSYSVSLDLLGRVIEVVTGKSFDGFLQERIFTPCGMTSTWFQVPQSERHRLTANYAVQDDGLLEIDGQSDSIFLEEPAFPFGGSGLVSSSRDYDRFLQMLAGHGEIDGVRVMSEPAVRLATSDLLPSTLAADGGFSTGGAEYGFGAGGMVGRGSAAGLFGWFGAAGTAGLVHMNWGLRANLMTQYMPATIYDVYGEFPIAVLQDAVQELLGS